MNSKLLYYCADEARFVITCATRTSEYKLPYRSLLDGDVITSHYDQCSLTADAVASFRPEAIDVSHTSSGVARQRCAYPEKSVRCLSEIIEIRQHGQEGFISNDWPLTV